MTECTAEQSYELNDAQRQRLALESLLGEPSPSWLVALATVDGVTSLARFHEVLAELPRAYPVLRTTFVTDGPEQSWHQRIRGCHEPGTDSPPIFHVPDVTTWPDLTGAMKAQLEGRNPDFRYAAAYGTDDDGHLRVAFAFDHMVFDIRSIDIVLAHLAQSAGTDRPSASPPSAAPCRCGGNEFVDFVRRTPSAGNPPPLPERYEWAHQLMQAARSPHAYVDLPVAIPMSEMDAGGTTRIRSRFTTDPARRHSYPPFAAFVSSLTLSLQENFDSPAMFYAPSLNRQPAEMNSVGWFAGTPILPVRSKPIRSAVAAGRVLDGVVATSEVKAATAETLANGPLLTTAVHRQLSDALGGRLPFMDCKPDSLPYIVLGYVDHVRERWEWTANGVTVRRARLPAAAKPPPLVPPGYILARLHRLKKGQWSVEVDYETKRYESGTIETLVTSTEGYLRQLLG